MAGKQRLTAKQARFVQEYMIDLNATAAAGRAGYSDPNYGRQLITEPNVSEAIRSRFAEQEQETKITARYVLEGLKEVAERCMQRAPVLNRKGEQIQDEEGRNVWAFDSAGANRSFELLGKHLGLFPTNSSLQLSLPSGGSSDKEEREGRRIARRLIIEEIREARKDIPDGEGE